MYNRDGKYKGVSFPEKVICNNNKGGNNNMYHKGQKCKPQNNCSEKKKAGGPKQQTKQKGSGRLACRGGGHQTTLMRKGRVDRRNNKQVSKILCQYYVIFLFQFEWNLICLSINHVSKKTLSFFLGLNSETFQVHDKGVQGPECFDGWWTVALSAFSSGKVHQGNFVLK